MTAVTTVFENNRVLRNTFLLLAISLLPTILGAWWGIELGLSKVMTAHPWLSLLSILSIGFALIAVIYGTAETVFGLVAFLGFALFEGLVLSGFIEYSLHLKNGFEHVLFAAGATSIILFGCSIYAMTTTRDLSGWGTVLFGLLIAAIVISIAACFIQLPGFQLFVDSLIILLFTAYTIYDVNQVVTGGQDNYILAALNIYLDLINLFVRILDILNLESSE